MPFPLFRHAACLTAALSLSAAAHAAGIAPSDLAPSNDETPILTLRHGGERHELARADIESLPLYDTTLRHFEGLEGRFTGVRLDRLIERHGLDDARRLRLIAADDYTIFLRPETLDAKAFLLVTRFEGEPLRRENLGPLMVVVPEDEQAVLSGDPSMTNWIWSLVEIRGQ